MLRVNNITKKFRNRIAVQNLSFNISSGEILGLIGQNGAGKTTTFKMILGFLKPDSGVITWNGHPISDHDYSIIGYLPEERGLYPKMTVEDQIIYFARLRGMSKQDARSRIPEWMELFQVKGKLTDEVKDLSKGNQQKIQLITTLIHMPKLLILDEPFSGLDPINAELLKKGVFSLKESGASIIYSSHNMTNVEEMSDNIVMLRSGENVLSGKVGEVRDSFGKTKVFIQSNLTEDQLCAFPQTKLIRKKDNVFELKLGDPKIGKDIFYAATADGYIPEFRQVPPSLDEIFKMRAVIKHG